MLDAVGPLAPLLGEYVCLESIDARGGHGHSALGHRLWKGPASRGGERTFWSEVWPAARQKGSVEAGLALGVTEFDPLLSTTLFTQSGMQKIVLDAAIPENMRKSIASPGKGERGWLKSV